MVVMLSNPYLYPSQGFQSEGLGKGSTFFIDLPIYTSRELHHDEQCLSNPAQQQLYSLSEEEEEDEDGGDDRQGAVVHPLTMFPVLAAMPSAIARLPMRILIVDDSSMNRSMDSSSHIQLLTNWYLHGCRCPKLQEDNPPHAGELCV